MSYPHIKEEVSYTAVSVEDTSIDSLPSYTSEESIASSSSSSPSSRPNPFLARLKSSIDKRKVLLLTVGSISAVLLGFIFLSDDLTQPSKVFNDVKQASTDWYSSTFGPGRASGLKACKDPWQLPGFIWYGEDSLETTWTPYVDLPTPEIAESMEASHLRERKDSPEGFSDVERFKPLLMKAAPGPASTDGSSLSSLLMQPNAANNSALNFLRNRNIAIVGSSIDRDATWSFCDRFPGSSGVHRAHHRHLYCHFPAFNLTIQSWFHFGMHQTTSDIYKGQDNVKFGVTFEDRLEKAFLPLVEEHTGRPDFIVLSSGRWDVAFYQVWKAKLRKDAGQPPRERKDGVGPEQLWYGELEYQRARLVDSINHLRALFPEAPFLLRTETTTVYSNGDVATFQLNQSLKYLAYKMGIPLFHWSELVRNDRSEEERKDYMHWNKMSHANWLYGEMLLWHVKTMGDPQQDLSCLLNRAQVF